MVDTFILNLRAEIKISSSLNMLHVTVLKLFTFSRNQIGTNSLANQTVKFILVSTYVDGPDQEQGKLTQITASAFLIGKNMTQS